MTKKVESLVTEEQAKRLMEDEEEKAKVRQFRGPGVLLITIIAVSMSIYQIYTGILRPFAALELRSIHLAFAMILVFLLYPPTKGLRKSRKMLSLDVALGLLSVIVGIYIFTQEHELPDRAGFPTTVDLVFGGILIVLVLEAARRTIGFLMPLLSVLFLLYSYFGPYMPEVIGHRGKGIVRIIEYMFLTTEGIYGFAIGVSASFIFLFVLFGAFLQLSGAGKFFIDIAFSLMGRIRGGPAQVAVLASAMFGTISGSGVANVATTGTFTIPLMKKAGFKPEFAGAVEALASTGGQIMPPIMGAAAFIMVEILGLPYLSICKAAAFPAILYFTSIGFMLYFRALRKDIRSLPRELIPPLGKVLRGGIHYFIPVGVLLFMLVGVQMTPTGAALWALFSVAPVSWLRRETRMSLRSIIKAMEQGARTALMIVSVCACAGLIIGVVTLTGLGMKLSSALIALSGGSTLILLILTMITCLILGMGLPTTVSYIILAVIVAPTLIQLGIVPIASHLFIFYFGVLALVTPPIAAAAYVGAGIADGEPMETCIIGVKLGLAAFIVPYMFIYNQSLLLMGSTFEILLSVCTALVGIVSLAVGVQGFMFQAINSVQRILAIAGAIFLIRSGWITDGIGLGILFIVIISQKSIWIRVKNKLRSEQESLSFD